MKAVLCPVCNGTGKVFDYSTTATIEKTCHGCNGKGWVEVHSGFEGETYYPPCEYPYTYPYYDPYHWITISEGDYDS